MTLYKNKYRIESTRLKGWDYSWMGYYFITFCTKNRLRLFGEIIHREMVLNEIGKIVDEEWNKSFAIRAELFCDIYVIMPDHIHAILYIDPVGSVGIDGQGSVWTHGRASQQSPERNTGIAFRSPKSISSFIAGFKSSATKRINERRNTPGMPVWQSRFHDHIIRNENALYRIRNFIEQNPKKYKKSKETI